MVGSGKLGQQSSNKKPESVCEKGVLERKLLLRSLKDTNSSRVKWEDCLRKLNDLTVADGAPTELKARAMADGKAVWSKTQKYLNLHFERSAKTALA